MFLHDLVHRGISLDINNLSHVTYSNNKLYLFR